MSAVSSSDVWAVGAGQGGSGYIEHWDGSQWHVVPSAPMGGYGELFGVSALSSNDVWAVGYYDDSTTIYKSYAEHWDGQSWTAMATPRAGTRSNELNAVVAVSPNDIWAVGYQADVNDDWYSLALHWDGTQWSVVPAPSIDPYGDELLAVSAISSSDVWAVGSHHVIEHWDGTQWSISQAGTFIGVFNGVVAITSDDVWAVGTNSDDPSQTLTEHWDGVQWTLVDSPSPGPNGNSLNAVSAVGPNELWAVGYEMGANHLLDRSLVLHYASPCLTPTGTPPTPFPTSTSTGTSTDTPTITPTATPTCGPGWKSCCQPQRSGR